MDRTTAVFLSIMWVAVGVIGTVAIFKDFPFLTFGVVIFASMVSYAYNGIQR